MFRLGPNSIAPANVGHDNTDGNGSDDTDSPPPPPPRRSCIPDNVAGYTATFNFYGITNFAIGVPATEEVSCGALTPGRLREAESRGSYLVVIPVPGVGAGCRVGYSPHPPSHVRLDCVPASMCVGCSIRGR